MQTCDYWKAHPKYHWFGLWHIDLPYGLCLTDSVNALGCYRMGWAACLELCIFLHKLNKWLEEVKA